MDDVQKLESALEGQLKKVRMQKQRLLLRNEQVRSILQTEQIDESMDANEDTIAGIDLSILQIPTTWQMVRDHVLHPRASEAIFKSKMFRKEHNSNKPKNLSITLQDVLEGNVVVELDAAQLEGWLDEEMFDVYSFPLLSETVSTLQHTILNL